MQTADSQVPTYNTISIKISVIISNIKYYNVNNLNYRKFLTEYGINKLSNE